MITFQANKINDITIQKINRANKAVDYKATVVEFDVKSKNDFETLRKIGRMWDKGSSYAADLFDSFAYDSLCTSSPKATRYFALTTQKKGFENVNTQEVLGVTSVVNQGDDSFMLQHLQVDPQHIHYSPTKNYKGIGSALINTIKNIFKNKEIQVYADTIKSEIFYEKHGFQNIPNSIYMKFKI